MDIRTRDEDKEVRERRSALYLEPGLANVIRKLARLENQTLDEMLEQLVREWCKERPQYELTEANEDKGHRRAPKRTSAPTERRQAKRRTKAGTAMLWDTTGKEEKRVGAERRREATASSSKGRTGK